MALPEDFSSVFEPVFVWDGLPQAVNNSMQPRLIFWIIFIFKYTLFRVITSCSGFTPASFRNSVRRSGPLSAGREGKYRIQINRITISFCKIVCPSLLIEGDKRVSQLKLFHKHYPITLFLGLRF